VVADRPQCRRHPLLAKQKTSDSSGAAVDFVITALTDAQRAGYDIKI
jgi:hypothetical protein